MFSLLFVFLHFLSCNISQSESKQDYNYFNDMVNYLPFLYSQIEQHCLQCFFLSI